MKARIELPFFVLKLIARIILYFFGFEVRGLSHLQQARGPVILAGNHAGMLDTLMVVLASDRHFRFLMTEEVFSWGLIGKLVPFANIIPLYKGRESRAMADIVRRVRGGESLCIFPEGRLTQTGNLSSFNEGVAFLQEKSGAPIVPFALHGGFEAWPQNGRPRRCKVVVEFGAPIPAGQYASRALCTAALKERVQGMLSAARRQNSVTALGSGQPETSEHSPALVTDPEPVLSPGRNFDPAGEVHRMRVTDSGNQAKMRG